MRACRGAARGAARGGATGGITRRATALIASPRDEACTLQIEERRILRPPSYIRIAPCASGEYAYRPISKTRWRERARKMRNLLPSTNCPLRQGCTSAKSRGRLAARSADCTKVLCWRSHRKLRGGYGGSR